MSKVKKLQKKAENLWKGVVTLRDKVCLGDGPHSEILQVHHLIQRNRKRGFLEINNGILLCRFCHFKLHHNDAYRMRIEDIARARLAARGELSSFDRLRDEILQGGAFIEWRRIGWLEGKIKTLESIRDNVRNGYFAFEGKSIKQMVKDQKPWDGKFWKE